MLRVLLSAMVAVTPIIRPRIAKCWPSSDNRRDGAMLQDAWDMLFCVCIGSSY